MNEKLNKEYSTLIAKMKHIQKSFSSLIKSKRLLLNRHSLIDLQSNDCLKETNCQSSSVNLSESQSQLQMLNYNENLKSLATSFNKIAQDLQSMEQAMNTFSDLTQVLSNQKFAHQCSLLKLSIATFRHKRNK